MSALIAYEDGYPDMLCWMLGGRAALDWKFFPPRPPLDERSPLADIKLGPQIKIKNFGIIKNIPFDWTSL